MLERAGARMEKGLGWGTPATRVGSGARVVRVGVDAAEPGAGFWQLRHRQAATPGARRVACGDRGDLRSRVGRSGGRARRKLGGRRSPGSGEGGRRACRTPPVQRHGAAAALRRRPLHGRRGVELEVLRAAPQPPDERPAKTRRPCGLRPDDAQKPPPRRPGAAATAPAGAAPRAGAAGRALRAGAACRAPRGEDRGPAPLAGIQHPRANASGAFLVNANNHSANSILGQGGP